MQKPLILLLISIVTIFGDNFQKRCVLYSQTEHCCKKSAGDTIFLLVDIKGKGLRTYQVRGGTGCL
jgi:hypothetical protein